MSRYWSDTVQRLTPYVPGEQPQVEGLIKLNTNECPYGPSPQVLQAIHAEVDQSLRLYPDPNADRLADAIANQVNQTHNANLGRDNVFLGNGSDEVLAHTFNALLQHEQPLLFPDISYSFYPTYCNLYNITYQQIPLRDDFSIAPSDYHIPNGGIVVANPNAPTGRALNLAAIETLLENNRDSVVVIDEAYIDFGGESAVGLIQHYDNALVVQTLSKSRSLAGLRVGFALGHTALIDGLQRVKNSFNSYPLSRMAISGAVAAVEDQAYFDEVRQRVIANREQLSNNLQALGFNVIPSAANFVFVSHGQKPAPEIAAALRQRKILVRHFNSPRINNYLRISVGTEEECQALVSALKDILS